MAIPSAMLIIPALLFLSLAGTLLRACHVGRIVKVGDSSLVCGGAMAIATISFVAMLFCGIGTAGRLIRTPADFASDHRAHLLMILYGSTYLVGLLIILLWSEVSVTSRHQEPERTTPQSARPPLAEKNLRFRLRTPRRLTDIGLPMTIWLGAAFIVAVMLWIACS